LRILVLSWAWPPIGRVGALRAVGMAREWVRAGHEVHVLTGPGDRGGEYAPDLAADAEATGAVVHRAPAPGIPPSPSLVPSFERDLAAVEQGAPVSRARQILAQWRRFPDAQRSWIRPALAAARELQAALPCDVVWSTSPPESVHFVARRLALDGLPWVADFRDPWSDYFLARWDPVSRLVVDRITRHVLRPARAITANTSGIAASIARASGREVAAIPNGYDPGPAATAPVRHRTLGYFGRLDPASQRLDRTFAALRLLRERGRPWTLVLHLTPGGGGGAVPRVPDDLAGQVHVNRALPHAEALRAMTGKLYEYVGSGRPVLVNAPSGSEARRLVESTGTGLGAWEEGEIAAGLERLEDFEASPQGRASLARPRFARDLLKVLEGACAAEPSAAS
jgi:hypothetical protein